MLSHVIFSHVFVGSKLPAAKITAEGEINALIVDSLLVSHGFLRASGNHRRCKFSDCSLRAFAVAFWALPCHTSHRLCFPSYTWYIDICHRGRLGVLSNFQVKIWSWVPWWVPDTFVFYIVDLDTEGMSCNVLLHISGDSMWDTVSEGCLLFYSATYSPYIHLSSSSCGSNRTSI